LDSSPDLSPFLLDLDLGSKDSDLGLDLKAVDLDLDSDLKVLQASPFFKSFVSTKYRSIRELVLGKMRQCTGGSKPTCVSVVRPSAIRLDTLYPPHSRQPPPPCHGLITSNYPA